MNIVNSGSQYQIFGEDLKTFKELPVASYEVCFHPMKGFFLQLRADLQVKEEKVYGAHERRVEKVLNAFTDTDRNLGIILSGQKGIGKSLFAKILAIKSAERNLPLINVSSYYPGVATFLSSIDQQVVVLFDEFEKTFATTKDEDPQVELLPLFDGVDAGKKLFVITCNDFSKLNSFLLNRPGRFHYHFTLTAPTAEEIREYMEDKLEEKYYDLIEEVVSFSGQTDLTYDCLRAITFELNRGYGIKETLTDLNIMKVDNARYIIMIHFDDGSVAESTMPETIDLFSTRRIRTYLDYMDKEFISLSFNTKNVTVDYKNNTITLDPNRAKIVYDFDYFEDITDEEKEEIQSKKVTGINFIRDLGRNARKYLV